jgi:hypothetical protein
LLLPTGPGWGVEINEEVIRAHPPARPVKWTRSSGWPIRYSGCALATLIEMRWSSDVVRPECGRNDASFVASRRLWQCKGIHARKQFTAKRGAIFEDSPPRLDKWFTAIWMIANCKNGISSYEFHRGLA